MCSPQVVLLTRQTSSPGTYSYIADSSRDRLLFPPYANVGLWHHSPRTDDATARLFSAIPIVPRTGLFIGRGK